MSLRSMLYTAMTGRQGDVDGKTDSSISGQLLAVGGTSTKTKSGINLTAAAHKLGVSRRTVERWVKAEATGTGQRPTPEHSKTLATKSRQVATTQAGRKESMANSPHAQAAAARGLRLSFDGMQGPRGHGKGYLRKRVTSLSLDPEEAAAMQAAYARGGDKAFMEWAHSHWDMHYLDDWQFGDLAEIKVEVLHGGAWR